MTHKLYGDSILVVPLARYMVFSGLALLIFMLVGAFSQMNKEMEEQKNNPQIIKCPNCNTLLQED